MPMTTKATSCDIGANSGEVEEGSYGTPVKVYAVVMTKLGQSMSFGQATALANIVT